MPIHIYIYTCDFRSREARREAFGLFVLRPPLSVFGEHTHAGLAYIITYYTYLHSERVRDTQMVFSSSRVIKYQQWWLCDAPRQRIYLFGRASAIVTPRYGRFAIAESDLLSFFFPKKKRDRSGYVYVEIFKKTLLRTQFRFIQRNASVRFAVL